MADTRLGPLKDPRSLDRGPALRGHGGWGRGRQEGDASNTATASDTSSGSSSSWKWNPGFLADTTAPWRMGHNVRRWVAHGGQIRKQRNGMDDAARSRH